MKLPDDVEKDAMEHLALLLYTFGGLHPQLVWQLTLGEYLNLRDSAVKIQEGKSGRGSRSHGG